VDAGYRHFDCAELYCNEASVGHALAQARNAGKVTRSELFIVSKAWNHHRTPAALRVACERSLKALQVDYLDLYLIHWPVCWATDSIDSMVGPTLTAGRPVPEEEKALADAWCGMEELVKAGLVRQIGVSNYGVKRLARLVDSCCIRPACNQVECHPHLAQRELLEYCQSKGIDLVAYHPIGKPNFRKEGEPVALTDSVIVAIAERLGCTPAQVILAWHMKRGICVIPKSCTKSRIQENFEASKVKLSDEDVAAISALDRNLQFCKPSWMANWD